MTWPILCELVGCSVYALATSNTIPCQDLTQRSGQFDVVRCCCTNILEIDLDNPKEYFDAHNAYPHATDFMSFKQHIPPIVHACAHNKQRPPRG